MSKLDLIRKYEPLLLFSKDDDGREENFFPFSVADYVQESTLHRRGQGVLKERAKLTLDYLGALNSAESRELYMSFGADEIISHDPSLRQQMALGGLAMYGIEGEGTPAAADQADNVAEDAAPGTALEAEDLLSGDLSYGLADAMQLPHEVHDITLERYAPYRDLQQHPPVYYYNVVYNRGYLVLQYWFFYAYNDWGTGHGGVNDHEGDWEMLSLFLRGDKPGYLAFSAHTGAPEIQAWDEPAIEKAGGDHPVIYVGCGSHANYSHSQVHQTASFRDCAYGNSDTSIGPGTAVTWGTPTDIGRQPWALNYAGGWGAMVRRFGSTHLAAGAQSPVGPVWQYPRWESPVAWARIPH